MFGLSESQIVRRVKAIAKAAGLADWEVLQRPQRAGGHGPPQGPERRSHPRDRSQGHWKQGGGMVGCYTRGESAGSALRCL